MKNIIFSIIIPVYNVELYLERCIESVLNQNDFQNEIILINDGSIDSSGDICDEYAKRYSHISVIHKKNGGLSEARNDGIKYSTGDYIIFLDSDDYLEENVLQRFNDAITDNQTLPDIIAAGTLKHENGERKEIGRLFNNELISGETFLKNELRENKYFAAACSSIYKREFLLQNKLSFPPNLLHEDEFFTPKAFLKAKHVLVSNIMFYHYIIRENSITTSKNKIKNAKSIFEISRQLTPIFNKIENKQLKSLLKNHLAKICLNIIEEAELYLSENSHIIDKDILKENSVFIREKIRYSLLKINPKLLHRVTNFKKK